MIGRRCGGDRRRSVCECVRERVEWGEEMEEKSEIAFGICF